MNQIKNENSTWAMRWDNMPQDAPKNVHPKYSTKMSQLVSYRLPKSMFLYCNDLG
jgi:hypothetical protein